MAIYYIVDDRDDDLEYLCSPTSSSPSETYYGGTWSELVSSQADCDGGWFQYIFNGRGVNVHASNIFASDGYNVSLDDTVSQPQSTNGSYESGLLQDGQHTLVYAVDVNAFPPTLDYLTVMAGTSTTMRGRTVIVDDAASDAHAVVWDDQWTTVITEPRESFGGRGFYNDSAHWVGSAGGTFSFSFIGTAVTVYSIAPGISGNVSLNHSIDGAPPTGLIFSNRGLFSVPMYKIVEADGLAAGPHILDVNVTSVENGLTLGIDFITYDAAFDNIDEFSAASPMSTASTKPQTAAIAGGVVGGLVFVGLFMLSVFVTRRRHRHRAHVAAVIGRNYNPQLDVKAVPRPEAYQMSSR